MKSVDISFLYESHTFPHEDFLVTGYVDWTYEFPDVMEMGDLEDGEYEVAYHPTITNVTQNGITVDPEDFDLHWQNASEQMVEIFKASSQIARFDQRG